MKAKKIICLLTCATLISLTGCGKSDVTAPVVQSQTEIAETAAAPKPATNAGVSQTTPEITNFTLQDIYQDISSQVELISPMEMPAEYIENYYAIDLTQLEDYVFSISEVSTSAETIVLMKLKDSAAADSIIDGMKLVIDEKKGEMENYLPEQYDLVARSSVSQKDNYLWLVISDNDQTIQDIIAGYIH